MKYNPRRKKIASNWVPLEINIQIIAIWTIFFNY